jgi:hypothetical protein
MNLGITCAETLRVLHMALSQGREVEDVSERETDGTLYKPKINKVSRNVDKTAK